jgi:dephospho-CoA kinase
MREARRHPQTERRHVLDVGERAHEIASQRARHLLDVAIDERRDADIIGRRDRCIVGAIRSCDPTRDVLDENELPRRESTKLSTLLRPQRIAARTNTNRDRAADNERARQRSLEKSAPRDRLGLGVSIDHAAIVIARSARFSRRRDLNDKTRAMHLFGLTGGIASGKSSASAQLIARGVPVIDADQIARDVAAKGGAAYDGMVRAFGNSVVNADGSLDRQAIAKIVFADDARRKELNAIVHPAITAETLVRAEALARKGEPLACYDAALLVENGVADAFRPLVVIAAPEELQASRAALRDGTSIEAARARIASQMPLANKTAAADFVIHNTTTLENLNAEVDRVLKEICARFAIDESRYFSASS